ncbi:type II secretion system protein GspM [Allosphingosinicella sp.]|uniref:type II secretion system protein GspM n=1 Tax=Allosphingosinicella sp. TaxID=2823234 RepID=UPI002FC1522F
MRDSFQLWWRTRTLREQRLLLAMAGMTLVVFAWLLIIRPLDDALSNARERHGDAVVALAEARARAALIAGIEREEPASLGASVDTIVSAAAVDAGFSVSRIEREGAAAATVVMDAVRPQAFFGWVGRLEGRGLVVERLTASTNSDQSLAVQVTFRARGG